MVHFKALYLIVAVVASLALFAQADPWGRGRVGGGYVLRRAPAIRTISYSRGPSSFGGRGRIVRFGGGGSREDFGGYDDDSNERRYW